MIVNYFYKDRFTLHIGLSRSCVIQHLTFSAFNEYVNCPPFPAFPTSLMKIWQTQWTSRWVPHSRRLILDSSFWILSLSLIWQMQWTSTTCLKAQCQIIKLSCARSNFLQMRPNVVKLCRVCTTLFYTNSSPMRPTIYATLNESQLLIVDTCLRKTILFKVMK